MTTPLQIPGSVQCSAVSWPILALQLIRNTLSIDPVPKTYFDFYPSPDSQQRYHILVLHTRV